MEIEGIPDKYVFVTGCDSGFGNLLCRKLDRKGFHVLAGCLTEKGADDLRRVAGPNLKTVLLNVTSEDSIQKAMEWTKKEVGEKGEMILIVGKIESHQIFDLSFKTNDKQQNKNMILGLFFFLLGLWGIVNNAGSSLPMGPSEWMRVEDFQRTLKVNMNGVIAMTMTFLPLIKKAHGRIVNVASVLGRVAANGGGYCISKFAVEGFSDCLRYDCY